MVKLPEQERQTIGSMENLLVRVPGGGEILSNRPPRFG